MEDTRMSNDTNEPSEQARMWRQLVDTGKKGASEAGYAMSRVPGRGLSNVWSVTKDGKTQLACIRTTRNRWIAFPPLNGGKKWKTLDDVELVIVAAVDSKVEPKYVEVYILQADEVRKRFKSAYGARIKEQHVVRDDFGMWVNLDPDARDTASSVGSGLAKDFKPVARYSIESLETDVRHDGGPEEDTVYADEPEVRSEKRPATIAEVMAWARARVAEIAGVRIEAVRLDLKLEG